ncbi:MAG TPA: hypothetical protein VE988_25755 [Gemmataceae bacterium]|nr:hypothetical protein [Gemmataceae bacterium]
MNRITRFLLAAIMAVGLVTLCDAPANGGRTGGPAFETNTCPANGSIFYDIEFNANEPAIVTVTGNGTNLDLLIYDSDGHEALGIGFADRKVATMNVYRAGLFRIEVRNLGPLTNTFKISTN